jgi:hypothetical protein
MQPLEVNALQPKREYCSKEGLLIGALESCAIEIQGKVYADVLATPQIRHVKLDLKVKAVEVNALDVLKAQQATNPSLFPPNFVIPTTTGARQSG